MKINSVVFQWTMMRVRENKGALILLTSIVNGEPNNPVSRSECSAFFTCRKSFFNAVKFATARGVLCTKDNGQTFDFSKVVYRMSPQEASTLLNSNRVLAEPTKKRGRPRKKQASIMEQMCDEGVLIDTGPIQRNERTTCNVVKSVKKETKAPIQEPIQSDGAVKRKRGRPPRVKTTIAEPTVVESVSQASVPQVVPVEDSIAEAPAITPVGVPAPVVVVVQPKPEAIVETPKEATPSNVVAIKPAQVAPAAPEYDEWDIRSFQHKYDAAAFGAQILQIVEACSTKKASQFGSSYKVWYDQPVIDAIVNGMGYEGCVVGWDWLSKRNYACLPKSPTYYKRATDAPYSNGRQHMEYLQEQTVSQLRCLCEMRDAQKRREKADEQRRSAPQDWSGYSPLSAVNYFRPPVEEPPKTPEQILEECRQDVKEDWDNMYVTASSWSTTASQEQIAAAQEEEAQGQFKIMMREIERKRKNDANQLLTCNKSAWSMDTSNIVLTPLEDM